MAQLAKPKRAYNSPRRQEQAHTTRKRIVQAALNQLQEKGYASMTLESIAREAGVAPQTVYAVCGCKKDVLKAILEFTVQEYQYDKQRDYILETYTLEDRLEAIADFTWLLHDNGAPGFQIMRSLDVVAPDLAELERDRLHMLYEKSLRQVTDMRKRNFLRPDLDLETANDFYSLLTSTMVFYRMRTLRGFDKDQYKNWLKKMLRTYLCSEPTPQKNT